MRRAVGEQRDGLAQPPQLEAACDDVSMSCLHGQLSQHVGLGAGKAGSADWQRGAQWQDHERHWQERANPPRTPDVRSMLSRSRPPRL